MAIQATAEILITVRPDYRPRNRKHGDRYHRGAMAALARRTARRTALSIHDRVELDVLRRKLKAARSAVKFAELDAHRARWPGDVRL